MQVVKIKFPNGEIFQIPADIIATERTLYYSNIDGYIKDSKEWDEEYQQSLGPSELSDWLQNNMDWEDVLTYAIKVNDVVNNYSEMWSEIEIL